MKIAIYSRKSVATGKRESIENQIEMCKQYISSYLSPLSSHTVSIYEDEGYSAKNMDRPQFQQMLQDIRKQSFDYLICYRLDRISRSVSDFAGLVEELNQLGIAFICIKEKFDTSTPMGKAMMYIASVFAQLERETIAERVRDNMFMLARSGRWLGGTTPTGYTACHKQTISVDGHIKNTCQLTANWKELAIVSSIYQDFFKYHSLTAVVNSTKKRNYKTRTGKNFSITSIKEILQNPVYCIADINAYEYFADQQTDVCFAPENCSNTLGLLTYHKRDYSHNAKRLPVSQWIVAIGQHTGIISGSDWVRAQQLLHKNKKHSTKRKAGNQYALLSGILTCGQCGEIMLAKARSNHPTAFDYICRQKLHKNQTCSCNNLNGTLADQHVLKTLLNNIQLYQDYELLSDLLQQKKNTQSSLKGQYHEQLKEIEKQQERLLSYMTHETFELFSTSIINQKLEQLEQERLQLKHTVLTPSSQLDISIQSIQTICENPSYLQNKLTLQQKRELIEIMVTSVTWNQPILHLTCKIPVQNKL